MKKGIKNADVVTREFGLALTRATNEKLEVAKKRGEKEKK